METLCLAEQYILRHTVYRNDLMKRCCPDLQIPQILMSVGSSGLTSPIDVNSILQLIGHEVYAYVLLTVHCTLRDQALAGRHCFGGAMAHGVPGFLLFAIFFLFPTCVFFFLDQTLVHLSPCFLSGLFLSLFHGWFPFISFVFSSSLYFCSFVVCLGLNLGSCSYSLTS